MPPKKREKKTKTRGQNIVQTVKVVVAGEGKRRKRQYKKRAPTGTRGRGQAGAVGPSTIYGEPLPLPPKVIEVPVPYRLTEGQATATGNVPAIMGSPAQQNLMIQAPQPSQTATIMELPSKKETSMQMKPDTTFNPMQIQDILKARMEEEEIANIKPQRSTFYRKGERRYKAGELVKEIPILAEEKAKPETMVSSYVVEEPPSLPPPEREVINIDIGEEKPPSLFKSVISGGQKLIGSAVEQATGIPIRKISKLITPAPQPLESESEGEIRAAAVAPSPIKRKANWNVTQGLISFYAAQTGKSPEQSRRALNKIRKEHPSVRPSDVITAIESGDYIGKTLA